MKSFYSAPRSLKRLFYQSFRRGSDQVSSRQNLKENAKAYVELKIKAFFDASADEYIKGKKDEPSG